MIRRADVRDVPAMAEIINTCAEYGQMLHRSLQALYENVRDFHVVEQEGEVVGVCGLKVVWANLAEVYSLAVKNHCRGQGLGGKLVRRCVEDARDLSIRRIMSLTYEQRFFERLGFMVVDRQQLPLKVWSECLRCPKNQACDEIAMILELPDVADVKAPAPQAPERYVMPVTLTLGRKHATAMADPRT